MPELFNRISAQLTEWWNKFSNKQKIAIITTVAVAIVALAVLVAILNQPNYVLLEDELDVAGVNERIALLDGATITYKVGDDASSILVEASSKTAATLALAEVGIVSSSDMTYKDAFNNGITTSNREALAKYQLFFQAEIGRKLEMISAVNDASVTIVVPDMDRALFEEQTESKASIILTLSDKISDSMVEAIAKNVAAMVTNLETNNITIIDSDAKLLYDGETRNGSISGGISGADYELQQELIVKDKVRTILLSGGEYDDAMVTVDLLIDFDQLERTIEEHTTQDGSSTGIVNNESTYTETSENTDSQGAPGTDSNGATDTLLSDGGSSTSEIEEIQRNYVYDTTITKSIKAIGGANYDESTVTVNLNKYIIYDEVILTAQENGPLTDLSWDEYKLQLRNQGNVKIENIDPDIERMVKNASNIDNVVVLAYEVPRFVDKKVVESAISDYILIGIIVFMILLLGYAVYKGTEPVEITEIEPELSVEDMLTSTKDGADLETIEFDGKSDTRVQIEEFVENNPDAAALLLRNWLNEDWE